MQLAVRAAQPSLSFDLHDDNTDPTGVTGWGDELWVVDNDTDRRYRYEQSDGSGGTSNVFPDNANSNATDMWVDGSTLWVGDWNDTRIYKYDITASGNLSDNPADEDINLAGANDGPRGVTGHDGTVWVVDRWDTYVYAYDTTTLQRVGDKEFDLKGGNGAPWGIWTDGATAWVNDRNDNIIRAYDLTTAGAPLLPDRDIHLHLDNGDPVGMWSDGETMWVADSSGSGANNDDYVYAYDLDDDRKSSRDIDLTGANDHPVRIAGDGTRIWVADSNDTYVYAYDLDDGNRNSDREFDMTHAGHNRTDGMWEHDGVMWMLEDSDRTLFTYNTTSGSTTGDGFILSHGLAPEQGVWGSDDTIWIVSPFLKSMYAYGHSGARRLNREVTLAKQMVDIAGMWSDGTVVWVLDRGNATNAAGLFAHRLSNGNRLVDLDIGLSPQNADPRGVYGHDDTIWVGDGDDTKLYAYEKSSYTDPSFPEGGSASRAVNENVPQGSAVGVPVAATDADGDPLTYSLAGADAAAFTVGTGNGQIRVAAGTSLDFETRQSYEVIVRVTDNRNLNREQDATVDDTITVTITVNNVDDPGTVVLSADTPPRVGVAVTAILSDPDGSVSGLSWQWARRMGTSGGFANIAGAAGVSYTPVTGDAGYFLRATASYTDGQGPNKTVSAVTAEAVVIPNDDPTFDAGSTTGRNVDENAAAGSAVGAPVAATDPDGDPLTYSLVGDGTAAFTVGTSDGQIRVAPGATLNFENRSTYTVTVRVSDNKDAISRTDTAIDDTIEVTITVNNVEEPGTVTLSTGAPQQGVEVTAELSDLDGSISGRSWQWWRGSSGVGPWSTITGAAAAGYTPVAADVDGYLRVTVSYTDGEGSGKSAETVSEQTVAGPVIVNEAPTFDEGTTAQRSVNENAAAGTNVGAVVSATDPDNDPLSYSLDDAAFTVNGSTGRIRVAAGANLNFENVSSYSLTMQVTDNKSPTGGFSSATDDIITVTVTINNVDEPGTVSFNTSTPQVDTAVMASLSDPDTSVSGLTWQWSRRLGTSGVFSNIAGAVASSYTPIAADVGYFLRATASYADDEGPSKTANRIVPQAVAATNAAPTFTEGATATRSVAENVAVGAAVGAPVAATDVDADELTYSLTGSEAAAFTIDASTGQIRVAPGAGLDRETKSTYVVTVQVRDNKDSAGLTDSAVDGTILVTITILSNQRTAVIVWVNPATSERVDGTDHGAILATKFTATAVPVEEAPDQCNAVGGFSRVDDNATPATTDDVVLIELNVVDIAGADGAGCRYDVTLDLPPGFSTSPGASTIKGVAPGSTVKVRVGVAGRTVLLVQNVVGDSGGGAASYELSTNCGVPGVLSAALMPVPVPVSGGGGAIDPYLGVELREGRFNISPAISADPASPRSWAGVPVPALDHKGEACRASVAVSDLPARCVAERAAVGAELANAEEATILEFRIVCGDDIESAPAAVLADGDELDAPVRVEVITPTVAGTYTVAWATRDGCDPGAGTSGMSGSVVLTVAATGGPDATPTPGELTGTAETISVMVSRNCAYAWWASAVEATTGAACSVGPAPLAPGRDRRLALTLVDPTASCTRDAFITVRVHPAAGTARSAVLGARFSAIAVPAKGAPKVCGVALAISTVDDSHTADDAAIIELPVFASTSDQQDCRYDVTLQPPPGFSTTPARATAENLEPGATIDFLTSTGVPIRTVHLVQNVTGDAAGARARFTLFSDCLPSVWAPTPPSGGIRPSRLVELRQGRFNISATFAAGPAALDTSSGAAVLVVGSETGPCEVTLSVSHLPERCSTRHPTATASLLDIARRATLELDITCRRTTPRTPAAQ